ncbi:thiamine ABC transporter substrate-binding protein [Micrococcus porci]|uniref:thiamine ABC transporter substrate-binding protein n=1 Tax=Micrococcus porci TaxID=2856555 RepID=UPI001CCFE14B|nr:thiamine ABC transporter substrate-binding protein [Micrococcus porci]UBH25425.1 thiamine ABC transporter substrate-binding protein [Micrococcus porci]
MSVHRTATTRRGVLAAACLSALALTGCSVSAPSTGSSSSAASSSAAPSSASGSSSTSASGTAAAGSKGTVTIMTHDSFALPKELIAQFEAESGYRLVTTAPGDAGAVVSQVLLSKDAPVADGVYGVENHSAHRLVDQGAVQDVAPADLPASAEDLVVDGKMIPVDQGQVCFNTDPAWFTEHGVAEPTSIDQLRDPEYAKLTAVTSPVTSSPGLALLAATTEKYGDDGWQGWWEDLLKGGAKVDSTWSDAYSTDFSGGEGKGEFPVVLSYSSSPAFAPQTAVIEDSCTPQVEYAGVLTGAENPEGAKAFVEFLLSKDVQAAIPENMYMYPVDDTVELPAEWAANGPLVEDPITPDPAEIDTEREGLLKEWTALSESAGSR